MPPHATVSDCPPGVRARISRIDAPREQIKHLLALGVRPGSEFTILHKRGRAAVLSLDGGRLAIGPDIAATLIIQRPGATPQPAVTGGEKLVPC